jgi:hypothetical protein
VEGGPLRQLLAILLISLVCWASTPQAQVTRYVYLTPVDGSGTDADPYISRCLREKLAGRGNIDFREVGINRFLCASDTLPADMTGVQELGTSLRARMTGPQKAALATVAGKAIAADTVDEAIAELLVSKIRAGRDGKIKIWLGESVPLYQQTAWVPFHDYGYVADAWNALQPAVAWATTLSTETFPTNGDLDASSQVYSWTEFNGTAWTVSGTAAVASTATTAEARLESDLATDDMEVSITITANTAVGESRCGVIGRKDTSTTRTYYSVHAVFDGVTPSNSEWRLIKRVAGTSTALGTSTTDPVVTDRMTLRSDGSSHSMYVNAVEFVAPVTDTGITGNTRVGIYYQGTNASDSCTLDNLNAADYTSSGALRRRNS